VDRIIAEAAAPVDADARLVCGFCRNRVVAACLQLAQQLATETPVPPPPPSAEAGAAASAGGPAARTRSDCLLIRILGGTQMLVSIVVKDLEPRDAANFGETCKEAHAMWLERVRQQNLQWLKENMRLTVNVGKLHRAQKDLINANEQHMKDKNAHNKILKMMRKEYDAMKDKVESEVHSPARVQRSLMSQIKKLEDQLGEQLKYLKLRKDEEVAAANGMHTSLSGIVLTLIEPCPHSSRVKWVARRYRDMLVRLHVKYHVAFEQCFPVLQEMYTGLGLTVLDEKGSGDPAGLAVRCLSEHGCMVRVDQYLRLLSRPQVSPRFVLSSSPPPVDNELPRLARWDPAQGEDFIPVAADGTWQLEVGDDGLQKVRDAVSSDPYWKACFPWHLVLSWLEGAAEPGTLAGKAYEDYPPPLSIAALHEQAAASEDNHSYYHPGPYRAADTAGDGQYLDMEEIDALDMEESAFRPRRGHKFGVFEHGGEPEYRLDHGPTMPVETDEEPPPAPDDVPEGWIPALPVWVPGCQCLFLGADATSTFFGRHVTAITIGVEKKLLELGKMGAYLQCKTKYIESFAPVLSAPEY
jgi:hypothetical protein